MKGQLSHHQNNSQFMQGKKISGYLMTASLPKNTLQVEATFLQGEVVCSLRMPVHTTKMCTVASAHMLAQESTVYQQDTNSFLDKSCDYFFLINSRIYYNLCDFKVFSYFLNRNFSRV